MRQPTVSAGLVAGLRDYAARRGASVERLLTGADLDALSLDDPDTRVPLRRYLSLMRVAQVETGDPALALHYGADVLMAELSIVGLIMEASPTMGSALQQLDRYGRLALEVETDGPRFELQHAASRLLLVERRAPGPEPELIEEAFARLVCGPRRFLPQPHVRAVHFAHAAPAHRAAYDEVFQCPVAFDARANMLDLHPDVASWPVAQHPRYVFGALRAKGDTLLADRAPRHSYRERLEDALRLRLHEGEPAAEALARHLGCSRSTLFRRLRDEGTTFTRVVEHLRRDLAIEYLRGGRVSVREVTYLVGFSDPAAFSRAFRRWTGRPPRELRQSSR
jgi:AraC-like DNA-binding protein